VGQAVSVGTCIPLARRLRLDGSLFGLLSIPTITKRHMTSICYWVLWECAAVPSNSICSSKGSSSAWTVTCPPIYAMPLFGIALLTVPEKKSPRTIPVRSTIKRHARVYTRRRTCSRYLRRSPTGMASLAKTIPSLSSVMQRIPLFCQCRLPRLVS
jgi:hypothetical protein